MSIINRMLRDLDERKDQGSGPAMAGGDMIRSVKPVSAWRLGPKALLALLGVGLVVVALAWWLQQRGWALSRPFALPAAQPAVLVRLAPPVPQGLPAQTESAARGATSAPQAAAGSSAVVTGAGQLTPAVAAKAVAPTPTPTPIPTAVPKLRPASAPTAPPAPAPVPAPPTAPALAPRPALAAVAAAKAVDAGGAPIAQATVPKTTELPARHGNAKTYSAKQVTGNLLSEAVLLDQQGRLDDAKAPLLRALAADPLNVEARQMLVRLQVDTGHLDEAQALLAEGHRLMPGQPSFLLALARLQAETGDISGAIKMLQGGLPAAGDDARYHAMLAALLLRAQRHDEAVKHYLVALRSDPANASWLVGVGVALEALGKRADAAEAYRRADSVGSLTPELARFVGDRLAQLGRRSL